MGAGAFRRRRRVFGHLYHPHLLVNSRRAIDRGPGKDPHVLLFTQEDGDSFYRNERNHLLAGGLWPFWVALLPALSGARTADRGTGTGTGRGQA